MKKSFFIPLAVLLIAGNSNFAFASEKDVLVLEGIVLAIKPLAPPTIADAIEDIPGADINQLKQVVRFEVTRIRRGTLKENRKVKEGSLVKQMFLGKDSLKEYDYKSSRRDLEDLRFQVAVTDAARALDLKPEEVGFARYQLFLKRYNNEETTFILSRYKKLKSAATSRI